MPRDDLPGRFFYFWRSVVRSVVAPDIGKVLLGSSSVVEKNRLHFRAGSECKEKPADR